MTQAPTTSRGFLLVVFVVSFFLSITTCTSATMSDLHNDQGHMEGVAHSLDMSLGDIEHHLSVWGDLFTATQMLVFIFSIAWICIFFRLCKEGVASPLLSFSWRDLRQRNARMQFFEPLLRSLSDGRLQPNIYN